MKKKLLAVGVIGVLMASMLVGCDFAIGIQKTI